MSVLLALGVPNMGELLVIAFLVMLLFGGSKLPQLMRNLGRSANEFKRGMGEGPSDDDRAN
jgi:sec-independent protein translocase protein TatA